MTISKNLEKLRGDLRDVYRAGWMEDDDIMSFKDCRDSFEDGFNSYHKVTLEKIKPELDKIYNRGFSASTQSGKTDAEYCAELAQKLKVELFGESLTNTENQ